MTVVVRMDIEHLDALQKAVAVLKAEQAVMERWEQHSVELVLVIDNLEELVDRYRDALTQHPDPWSRKVKPFEVVK